MLPLSLQLSTCTSELAGCYAKLTTSTPDMPAAQSSHCLWLRIICQPGGTSSDDDTQLTLCRLSLKVLADPALAASATLLFCFNPASVFFSAAYTEGLFAGLTMAGLYHQASRPWTSAVSFAAASATRSNGEH